jgi:inactive dipeptidyl peptidase 10
MRETFSTTKHVFTSFLFLPFSNGKPGETAVADEFRIDWGTYMSSHNDVIYIRLDVRGSKGQGKKKLYRHLGGVEVADQIAVLE